MNNGIVRSFKNKKRIIAVGDIHGCYDLLMELMNKINFKPADDILIFLGDYIDRGKEDYLVIKYLYQLQKENPRSVFLLKGNHEQMAELALKNPPDKSKCGGYNSYSDNANVDNRFMYSWKLNGATAHNWNHEKKEFLLDFIDTLPMYLLTDDFVFVHAGCRNDVDIHKQSDTDLLWNRDNHCGYKGRVVVAGHTPTNNGQIYDVGIKIIIDTGAFRYGVLTAYDVVNSETFQAGKLCE